MQSSITPGDQTEIPREIREQLNLRPGDRIDWRVTDNGEARVVPVRAKSVFDLIGSVQSRAEPDVTLTDEELDEVIADCAASPDGPDR